MRGGRGPPPSPELDPCLQCGSKSPLFKVITSNPPSGPVPSIWHRA